VGKLSLALLMLAGCNREPIAQGEAADAAVDDAAIATPDLAAPDLLPTCPIFTYANLPIDALELADPAMARMGSSVRVRARVTVGVECDLDPRLIVSGTGPNHETIVAVEAWRRASPDSSCGNPDQVSLLISLPASGLPSNQLIVEDEKPGTATLTVPLLPEGVVDCQKHEPIGGPCEADCQCLGGFCLLATQGPICAVPCQEDSDCPGGDGTRCDAATDPPFTCVGVTPGCMCNHHCPFDHVCDGCRCVPSLTETICPACPVGLIPNDYGCVEPCDGEEECAFPNGICQLPLHYCGPLG
jgi:hypothetical protein